jgi:hypothetical protein
MERELPGGTGTKRTKFEEVERRACYDRVRGLLVLRTVCRLQVGDTSDCKSALRNLMRPGKIVGQNYSELLRIGQNYSESGQKNSESGEAGKSWPETWVRKTLRPKRGDGQ